MLLLLYSFCFVLGAKATGKSFVKGVFCKEYIFEGILWRVHFVLEEYILWRVYFARSVLEIDHLWIQNLFVWSVYILYILNEMILGHKGKANCYDRFMVIALWHPTFSWIIYFSKFNSSPTPHMCPRLLVITNFQCNFSSIDWRSHVYSLLHHFQDICVWQSSVILWYLCDFQNVAEEHVIKLLGQCIDTPVIFRMWCSYYKLYLNLDSR